MFFTYQSLVLWYLYKKKCEYSKSISSAYVKNIYNIYQNMYLYIHRYIDTYVYMSTYYVYFYITLDPIFISQRFSSKHISVLCYPLSIYAFGHSLLHKKISLYILHSTFYTKNIVRRHNSASEKFLLVFLCSSECAWIQISNMFFYISMKHFLCCVVVYIQITL